MIPEINRRRVLQLGAVGLLGASLGRPAWAWAQTSGATGVDAALAEPETIRSANGFLRVELEVAETSLTVGGRPAVMLTYNGTVPGPTIRVRPGDRLQVRLTNRLAVPTNLHTHGLHVSPAGNGDNTFVHVHPGESFDYEYQLPDDHPPGPFWYHPHEHHLVADQIWSGLYGGIVVEDLEEVPVSRDRVLVISDTTLDASGHPQQVSDKERMMGREGQLILVDGQLRPTLTARPGERERWRIVNACTSRYLRLRLDGQRLDLLATDIGRLPEPRRVEEIVLFPSSRADVLVSAVPGVSALEGLAISRMRSREGGAPSGAPGALATFQVSGSPVPALPPVPPYPEHPDLRGAQPAARRQLVLAMGEGGSRGTDDGAAHGTGESGVFASIDGRPFDPDRTDQVVHLGTVEEWTIRNHSGMNHPFHLHVWPMQHISTDGRAVGPIVYLDVVDVPAGGEVTVRIPFEDFAGRTVYHCHINDHEDGGMMGVVEARAG
ncbi:multicopper oxidase family protein [Geodermatophilus sp. TF02-6]|uniref:multicopper oxidase family protein n=1 Tax=Geodermatophilus sp. TF02-6 TaxID=2250575 RepID=UPI001F3283E3|nr:multicopper oxidase family protein [Geodermatophilus sp. TF02-6]